MEAARDNADRSKVSITCHMATPVGPTCVGSCRIEETAFARVAADVVRSFHAMSDAKGMEMTDREIRENCWGPMLDKLGDGVSVPVGGDFRERALCFVVWVAFGDSVRNGDVLDIVVSRERDTEVVRRPRRWWRINRRRLGRLPASLEKET
jgi:hypothetical protein